MAMFFMRTIVRHRRMMADIIESNKLTDYRTDLFALTYVQCCSYHTTPVCYKRRKTAEERKQAHIIQYTPKAKVKTRVINVWPDMTVMELAQSAERSLKDVEVAMSYASSDPPLNPYDAIHNMKYVQAIVKFLGLKHKVISNPNNSHETEEKDADVIKRLPPKPEDLVKRHPVVTVMGHVDHGKTTLLDSLRNTSVVATEFGGITQAIGAFNVNLSTGERMTFLDTPGHAAFSAMRARGAHVTDIVVLVVAADDGVMEQTVQSIEMAKDANVPIIVAINKIDKPDADIPRTQKMLAQFGILVEDLGGDTQSVNVSALKNINLNLLTECIAAQAEVMDLKGDPTGFVEGVIIESSNHPGRGKLATTLIRRGTLRKGAILVSGLAWAKVRSMFDHTGTPVMEAKLSEAVQIIGWRELPSVGEEILEVETEQKARSVMRFREGKLGEQKAIEQRKAAEIKLQAHLVEYKAFLAKKRLAGRFKMRAEGPRKKESEPDDGIPKVSVVVKGDVAGSVEAILDVLNTYTNDKLCRLDVIHYGVGPITETDVELAKLFNGIIYSFNVVSSKEMIDLAKSANVPVKRHNVIYKLIDDLKEEINNKLPLVEAQEVLGEAHVLQQFNVTEGKKKVKVAGCRCVKGTLKKNEMYRLIRNNETIAEGKLISMKHLKDEVNSISTGVECGLRMDDPLVSFLPGDTLVCYRVYEKEQKTDWDPGF